MNYAIACLDPNESNKIDRVQFSTYDSFHLKKVCLIAHNINNLIDSLLIYYQEQTTIGNVAIIAHGSESYIGFGEDMITDVLTTTAMPWQLQFQRLSGVVKGYIHLQHCYAGTHTEILKRIAAAAKVPVWGGTGYDWTVFQSNSGQYVCCSPDGTVTYSDNRPD